MDRGTVTLCWDTHGCQGTWDVESRPNVQGRPKDRVQDCPISAWPLCLQPYQLQWAIPVLTIPHDASTCWPRTHTVLSGRARVTIRLVDLELGLVHFLLPVNQTKTEVPRTPQISGPVLSSSPWLLSDMSPPPWACSCDSSWWPFLAVGSQVSESYKAWCLHWVPNLLNCNFSSSR